MINLKSALGITMASIAAVQAAAQKTESFKPVTPNIVLILMDDMGYGDIGRTGANQYTTPNLDRLANQGMQFTRYYCPQAVSSASRAGLCEGKGTSWEGGQRVPCIMRWPDIIPAGVICNQLASSLDILPTLTEITGGKLPSNKIDGISILPLMLGDKDASPRHEFYYYYETNSLEAVQRDFWKLVLPHKGRTYRNMKPGSDGWPGPTGTEIIKEPQLYDLRRDPGEWYDVALYYPEKVKELQALAEQARKDLGDDLTNSPGENRRKAGSVK